ncbi:MAG: Gfo/Idh/MocA family oxidoreductase [Chloroflexi bacterium]|jgi:predicted dehydrogenase|nr:Gfo/Idh/MocA family oxidoreductase [Chloroflexota bacterium]
MTQPVTAVLFGAGLRGADAYAPYALAHPDELKFVAVAEPDRVWRARFAAAHGIVPERQFTTWEEVVAQPKLVDAVFNCTMDQTHYASGMAALKASYGMLLEKPMTNTLAETVALVNTVKDMMAFAAEQSRHEKIVVDMDDYRQQADNEQFNSLTRTSSRLVYHGRGDDHAQNHVYWSWKYCICKEFIGRHS